MDTLLTLGNLCSGSLEQQFQALYPDMLAKCASGEKATMTITISFERIADTATMTRVAYDLKTKTPGYGKQSLCQLDADFNLKTEAPEEKPEPVSLFQIEGGKK